MPWLRFERLGLGTRLVLLGALAALLVSGIGGWVLRQHVRSVLLNSFEQRLDEKAERLAASASSYLEDGQRRWQVRSADQFARIFSGWYWQLESGETLLASRSLWDGRLDRTQARPVRDRPTLHRLNGPQDMPLLGLSRHLEIDGQAVQLHVYGPADEMLLELARLDRILILTQLGLLISLVLTSLLQVRLGLRPVRRLRAALAEVRAGTRDAVGSPGYGPDLDPLAAELDGVLARNAKIVTRARAHAADLSHALKKPLSVLRADAGLQQQALLQQQLTAMSQLIDRYLARAGSGAGVVQRIAVAARVEGLIALMRRIHGHRVLDWRLEIEPALAWRGEPTDFEEMLGNLLDNAAKWAASCIVVRAVPAPDGIMLEIADDGPGLSEAQIQQIGVRGRRFDETVEGSGLGLVIVSDIAETYGGALELGRSEWGGLRACLRLPG